MSTEQQHTESGKSQRTLATERRVDKIIAAAASRKLTPLDAFETNGSSPPKTVSRFYVGRLPGDEQEVAKVEQFLEDEFKAFTRFDGTGAWQGEHPPTTVYEVVEFQQRGPRAPYIAQVIRGLLNVPGRERESILWTAANLLDAGFADGAV